MGILLLLALLNFTVKEEPSGVYSASYREEGVSIYAEFPGKPEGEGGKLTYVTTNPIVQMSLALAKHDKTSSKALSSAILETVLKEYQSAQMEIQEIKTGSEEEGPSRYSIQYIIDLESGIREFLTLTLFRSQEVDLMALTRFILSPEQKEELSLRVKGNSLAEEFQRSIKTNLAL